MKAKIVILLSVWTLVSACSGNDSSGNNREAFVGTWKYGYRIACVPSTGLLLSSDILEISEGEKHGKLDLNFDRGLSLKATVFSKTLFGIIEYQVDEVIHNQVSYYDVAYSGTGNLLSDGKISLTMTYMLDELECTQQGTAEPFEREDTEL